MQDRWRFFSSVFVRSVPCRLKYYGIEMYLEYDRRWKVCPDAGMSPQLTRKTWISILKKAIHFGWVVIFCIWQFLAESSSYQRGSTFFHEFQAAKISFQKLYNLQSHGIETDEINLINRFILKAHYCYLAHLRPAKRRLLYAYISCQQH